jgi:predicted HicB family RNase H-like nuclease
MVAFLVESGYRQPGYGTAVQNLQMIKGGVRRMTKNSKDRCADPAEEITIRIPCALAQRIAAYAADNQTSVSSVVIEALDFFLRRPAGA